MKIFLILLFVLSLIFGQERSADIVIIAPTYTMDKNQPWADAASQSMLGLDCYRSRRTDHFLLKVALL